jgi:hypothetical protein
MTEKQFEEIKQSYINHLKNYISQTGELFPHVTIFAEHLEEGDDKPAIIHIPIPDEFMENDDSKDIFIQDVMPEIMIEIKKQFIPNGVAWASEAWMRTADKDFNIENYKTLPKQEVVFISIETKDNAETRIYEMIREGVQVNSDGDLTNKIELKEMHNIEKPEGTNGRFAGLYKKLINNETD